MHAFLFLLPTETFLKYNIATLSAIAGLTVNAFTPASAQTFPEKPIRWIVPYTAGGGTDVTARLIAKATGPAFNGKDPFIDNKPGGATVIGTQALVTAKADGYTIGSVSESLAVNEFLMAQLPYRRSDLEAITAVVKIPMVIAVPANFPANTLEEFLAVLRKSDSKSYNFSSWGIGSTAHLSAERLADQLNANVTHIPYQGAAPMVMAVVSGEVDFCFCEISSSLGFIKDGRIKAIAVSTKSRSKVLPNVPAVSEVIPGFEAFAWNGIAAPKGIPGHVKDILVKGIRSGLASEKVREDFASKGYEVWASSPAEMEQHLQLEAKTAQNIIKKRNIKL